MNVENWQRGGFGLYLHWPFCQAKCPYCDFNSHVSAQVDQDSWTRAFLLELQRAARRTPDRILSTIFFGGGTPSLMEVSTVEQILAEVHDLWPVSNDLEITLEANPTSSEADRFAGYRAAGVNRVSIGVQALNDPDLKRLGRLHSAREALKTVEMARNLFDRVSFDLIYGRQDQTFENWRFELEQCLDFEPDHLSLYQLTIENGTAFGTLFDAGKLQGLPDSDLGADMFDLTQDMTSEAGLPAYEVSNHARPGLEARHNQIYWRGGDWLGIGPGASGRIFDGSTRLGSDTEPLPRKWLSTALEQEASQYKAISRRDAVVEYLMMSLRMNEGTDLDHLADLDPDTAKYVLDQVRDSTLPIEIDGTHLKTTSEGRLLLNSLLVHLIPDSAPQS